MASPREEQWFFNDSKNYGLVNYNHTLYPMDLDMEEAWRMEVKNE
jgi:hypothetical protein